MATVREVQPGEPRISGRIDITTDLHNQTAKVVVDGTDITYWITAEPITIEHLPEGGATLSVKLIAGQVTHTIIPT